VIDDHIILPDFVGGSIMLPVFKMAVIFDEAAAIIRPSNYS